MLINENTDIPHIENVHFLHLYNEMWRRAGVDKNEEFPKNCLYERFGAMFGIK